MYVNGKRGGVGAVGPYGSFLWWLTASEEERAVGIAPTITTPRLTPPAPITEPMLRQWTPEVLTEATAQRTAGFVQAQAAGLPGGGIVIQPLPGDESLVPWWLYLGLGVGALALLMLVVKR